MEETNKSKLDVTSLLMPEEEFIKLCDKITVPEEEIEKYKKARKSVKRTTTAMIIGMIIGVILFIVGPIAFIPLGMMLFFVSAALGMIFIHIKRYKWENFKAKHGNEIVAELLKGYKHIYKQNEWIGPWILIESKFVRFSYDTCYGEDLLIINIPNDDGTPSDVQMVLCDAKATETTTDMDGDRRTHTRYDGVIGYIKFPFEFKCNLGLNACADHTEKLSTEDVEFNNKFAVFTDDKVEAMCILTPEFMQKLKEYAGKNRLVRFNMLRDGTLYFGMDKHLFMLEISKYGPSGKMFKNFYRDIYNILLFVNEIKTNDKIFKM